MTIRVASAQTWRRRAGLPALLVFALGGCGILEPLNTVQHCNRDCDRHQLGEDMVYWEHHDNPARFYSWLETLSKEQVAWLKEDWADPAVQNGSSLPAGALLLPAIVIALGPAGSADLGTASGLVGNYLDQADPATGSYAFALLLQSSLSNAITGEQQQNEQHARLIALEGQLGREIAAREALESQLKRLKQIESSLTGDRSFPGE